MVTTVIKSVKAAGGGDYSTLAAWELGRRGDIRASGRDTLEIAEVYGGGDVGTVGVGYPNWQMDATHYAHIRAASGEGHNGVYDTNKAYISGSYPVILNFTGYVRVGPGISINASPGGIGVTFDRCGAFGGHGGPDPMYANATFLIDGLIFSGTQTWAIGTATNSNGVKVYVTNCIFHAINSSAAIQVNDAATVGGFYLYNCTVINRHTGTGKALNNAGSGLVTTENCYFHIVGSGTCYSGTITKGTHDATSNTEATTPALRNVAYSTTNFNNVTAGSEDLDIKSGSVLNNGGAYLVSQGVTTDVTGASRVGFIFDIGAYQLNDIPFCWNYTARYKGSKRLFKVSGGGAFPKNLRIPSNIDKSTGRMIDDGKEIDPDHYEVF